MSDAVVSVSDVDSVERVSHSRKHWLIIGLTALAAGLAYLLLPASIDELQRRTIAIFIVAGVFWATEVLPLFATSLLVIAFEILFLANHGGLGSRLPTVAHMPVHSINYAVFLQSFGSPIIILFMGGFLLSAALTKHGLDRAIAARILSPLSHSALLLIFGVLTLTAFFSMWMSNTATAAMMLAVLMPVLKSLPKDSRLAEGLVLAVPFGANIGGLGTPIGTPPNAIAFGTINAAHLGHTLTFIDWVILALPLELLLILIIGLALYLIYRPRGPVAMAPIERPQKTTGWGRLTLFVLGFAIILWLTESQTGLKAAAVALLVAAALAAFGALNRDDIKSIDWDILVLMWGGLSLGTAIDVSGLTGLIGSFNFSAMPGGGWGVAAAIVILTVALSTVISNTAAANLIVPIAIALSVGTTVFRVELAVLAGLAASLAMALPVSTPPNAMAFATGRVKTTAMVAMGGAISVLGVFLLLLGYKIVFPTLLGWQ